MHIRWFFEEIELFTTDGELPQVGDVVYINDYRRGHGRDNRDNSKKRVVKKAYHTVMVCHKDFDSFKFPDEMEANEKFDYMQNSLKREGFAISEFDIKTRTVIITKRAGEVFLDYAEE